VYLEETTQGITEEQPLRSTGESSEDRKESRRVWARDEQRSSPGNRKKKPDKGSGTAAGGERVIHLRKKKPRLTTTWGRPRKARSLRGDQHLGKKKEGGLLERVRTIYRTSSKGGPRGSTPFKLRSRHRGGLGSSTSRRSLEENEVESTTASDLETAEGGMTRLSKMPQGGTASFKGIGNYCVIGSIKEGGLGQGYLSLLTTYCRKKKIQKERIKKNLPAS